MNCVATEAKLRFSVRGFGYAPFYMFGGMTMKKVLGFALILLIVCVFIFSSCDNGDESHKQGTDHVHLFEDWITTKKASCTEDGINERYCACGEKQTQSIAAIGHTEVIDAAISATCISDGKTEGKHCSVCNEVLIQQNTIKTSGHDWGNPTCTTPRSCCVCYEVDPNSEPIGHSYVQGECIICGDEDPDYNLILTSSTYNINLTSERDIAYITMIGGETVTYDIADTSIVYCNWGDWDGDIIPLNFYPISTGSTFVTVYIKNTNKSIRINVEVKEHSHEYSITTVNPTCTEQGYTLYSCNCDYSYRADYIKANGHTEVIVPGVEATLTSTGLTEGKYCSVCQKVLVEQKIIPMLELTPADETTFELTNKLSETYGYYNSRLQAYTKCKIDSVDCEIVNSSGGKVTLKIKLLVEKTYQGDTSLDNLKFDYTIYRNGVAVKSSFVTILHTEFGTLYETTITYTGEAGEYTMKCESYY